MQFSRRSLLGYLRQSYIPLAICCWLCAVVACYWWMSSRQLATPTAGPHYSEEWPEAAALERPTGSALVLFIHPRCPCTRSTLRELERLLAKTGPDYAPDNLLVLVTTPAGVVSENWTATGTVTLASKLPGARVVQDSGGELASLFGARASGSVLFFNELGRCVYAGGVTSGRGHEGGSAGGDALRRALAGEAATRVTFPAFGCLLCLPDRGVENDDPVHAARMLGGAFSP